MRHPVRARIRHPGARGKRTWGRVLDQARRTVPELVADEVNRGAALMAREEIRVELTADDEASRVIDDVADKADRLEDDKVALDVTADTSTAESNLAGLGTAADKASADVRKVGDSSDQSRSVLANLVGNSAQDLGELGGVAGTAGVAIGQLAEYAADGNIALKGLVATAAPMLALGIAVKVVSDHFADAKREAEELKKTNQEIAASLRAGDIEAAAKAVVTGYEDLISQAEDAGVSVQELTAFLTGQTDSVATLFDATAKLSDQQIALALNAAQARASFDEESGALATNAARQQIVQDALGETRTALDDATQATKDLTAAYDLLTGRLDDEASYLSAQSAIDAVNDALADAMTTTAEYGAASEEAQDANRRLAEQLNTSKGQVLDYAGAVASLPPEQATEITALIDQGKFAEAEARLAAIERTRTAHVNLEVIYGRNRPLGYPAGAPWPPSGGAVTTNVNVNMPRGTRPADAVRAFESYARRNGRMALRR